MAGAGTCWVQSRQLIISRICGNMGESPPFPYKTDVHCLFPIILKLHQVGTSLASFDLKVRSRRLWDRKTESWVS